MRREIEVFIVKYEPVEEVTRE